MSDATYPKTAVGAFMASLFAMLALSASASPAAADFRMCNNTASRVGAAVGYKDADGWTTEGWWNLPARSCETVLKGNLVARYYYVYAIDYDHGGEWMGEAFMCNRDKRPQDLSVLSSAPPTLRRSSALRAGCSRCRLRSNRLASIRSLSIRASSARTSSRKNLQISQSGPLRIITSAGRSKWNSGKATTESSPAIPQNSRRH